jgi:hypothetical protein
MDKDGRPLPIQQLTHGFCLTAGVVVAINKRRHPTTSITDLERGQDRSCLNDQDYRQSECHKNTVGLLKYTIHDFSSVSE